MVSSTNDNETAARQALLRSIPKVDECLDLLTDDDHSSSTIPRSLILQAIREVLDETRKKILTGGHGIQSGDLAPDTLVRTMRQRIATLQRPQFRRVINGTGVIIHTNLGRSLLPEQTMQTLIDAGCRYSNLEYNLQTGTRGSRYSLVEKLLCRLTGAEAALVVNNNAAAVLIVLETLAKGREVIVSRGQLVEIGGSFRIPDVMERSGARLREVGATNRTHLHDYEDGINEETALLMKVHNSNYRIIGFTKEVSMEELVSLGHRYGLPVVEDLGSGCFVDLSRFGLMKEPTVQEVVKAGVDVVTFSGDKLLGGPQAGIILGRREIVEQIKKNPLNRALRIDKFTLSGLESVLRFYQDEEEAVRTIPTLAMIALTPERIHSKAQSLARQLRKDLSDICRIRVEKTVSRVGGGAMPEQNLPSHAVGVKPYGCTVNQLERKLRDLDTPIIGRIEDESLLLDMRTVSEDEITLIADSLARILRETTN